jgi:hypothetical protein
VSAESPLTSGVVTSPADALLREAIDTALRADPHTRADLLERLLTEIQSFMAAHPQERPWTFTPYTGTDGSRIFRGGVGHSMVVDPAGVLWRARSHEDFDTTFEFIGNDCRISSLTPRYDQMRPYESGVR